MHNDFVIDIEFRGQHGTFEYKTLYSVGADVPAQDTYAIRPGEIQLISTGLFILDVRYKTAAVELPMADNTTYDYLPELQVRPRSGLSKKGIVAHFGSIDPDYREEIKVCLHNLSDNIFYVNKGDRVAQLVAAMTLNIASIQRSHTVRDGGFGHTGIN
jgi:dUTP pyrophosphatase